MHVEAGYLPSALNRSAPTQRKKERKKRCVDLQELPLFRQIQPDDRKGGSVSQYLATVLPTAVDFAFPLREALILLIPLSTSASRSSISAFRRRPAIVLPAELWGYFASSDSIACRSMFKSSNSLLSISSSRFFSSSLPKGAGATREFRPLPPCPPCRAARVPPPSLPPRMRSVSVMPLLTPAAPPAGEGRGETLPPSPHPAALAPAGGRSAATAVEGEGSLGPPKSRAAVTW
mmetsp:Transcript_43181/g.85141  ORF Transcript_43181/g.85141 Transcript_43181/m.85141 type:complete len:233 (-) Transcript_43181:48-746(-)